MSDKLIDILTGTILEIPERLVFDIPMLRKAIDQLLRLKNQADMSMVELDGGAEILLKEIGLSLEEGVLVNAIDVYGVRPIELKEIIHKEIYVKFFATNDFLIFGDLSLIELKGRTATFELVTVLHDDTRFKDY